MEGHFSTGQSPQWAVVPMEEEDIYIYIYTHTHTHTLCNLYLSASRIRVMYRYIIHSVQFHHKYRMPCALSAGRPPYFLQGILLFISPGQCN